MTLSVEFKPNGRGKAQCPANENFPDGKTIVIPARGRPTCSVDLPYPAPECGAFIVTCKMCGRMIAVTAAGRADDPKKLVVPCNIFGVMNEQKTAN